MSTPNKENGIGLAGGIIGIVMAGTAPILSWILAPLYIVGAAVAVILSAIGLRKALKAGTKKAMSITGLATAVPTLLWSFIWTIALAGAVANSSY